MSGDNTEKIDRLEKLEDMLFHSPAIAVYPLSTQSRLLHEALDLCLELGLDHDWRRFKAKLEKLQQSELQRIKKEGREE